VDEAKGKPANYISCVVWRQGADFLGQYARKGDLIAVDGRITTRSYDKDGHKVFVTEVVADKVEIMAHKGQNKQGDNFTGSQQTRSQTDFTRNQGEYYQQPMNEPAGLDIGPDDLPF
jgi:single-strand DNA-binding protein